MNIRRKSKLTSEVSTSSLNDIMFFLLLFFLIASTMANPNVIKVLLPQANSTQQFIPKSLTLTVSKDMEYFLETQPMSKEEIKAELQTMTGAKQDLSVVLNIDSKVEWQYVAELLDMGKELKIKMVAAARKK